MMTYDEVLICLWSVWFELVIRYHDNHDFCGRKWRGHLYCQWVFSRHVCIFCILHVSLRFLSSSFSLQWGCLSHRHWRHLPRVLKSVGSSLSSSVGHVTQSASIPAVSGFLAIDNLWSESCRTFGFYCPLQFLPCSANCLFLSILTWELWCFFVLFFNYGQFSFLLGSKISQNNFLGVNCPLWH